MQNEEGKIVDHAEFIRQNTKLLPVPHAPTIKLHLAEEATPLWEKTEEELSAIGLPPPFWAFAWAGGQALARYILDHPQIAADKKILDFAAGSGLVGIAAARAGAAHVTATDIDPFAIDAMHLNAAANDVRLQPVLGDVIGSDEGWDVVFAGDVSYECDMAARVTEWLYGLKNRGAAIFIGDPGRAYLARNLLESIAVYAIPTTRALEDSEVKRTGVWRFKNDYSRET